MGLFCCCFGEVRVGSLAEDMDQLAAATGTPGTVAGPWRLAWQQHQLGSWAAAVELGFDVNL